MSIHSIRYVWQDLLDRERPLPKQTDTTPETSSVHTNKAKSFECHSIWVVIKIGIHELVGRNPFSEGACMLPHIEVVLRFLSSPFISFLFPGSVHIAAIKEGTTRLGPCQLLARGWAVDIGFSEW